MSLVSKMPILLPRASFTPLSISSTVVIPSSTSLMASMLEGKLSRLITKPATSRLTMIGSLPMRITNCLPFRMVSSDVD